MRNKHKSFSRKYLMDIIDSDWESHSYRKRLATCISKKLNETIVIVDSFGTTTNSTDVLNHNQTISEQKSFRIPKSSWNNLHAHQQIGVAWLWGLYINRNGGILGDEMGLGKTAQLCVHFSAIVNNSPFGLNSKQRSKHFLILCPATVLHHWKKEMLTWNPMSRVLIFHTISHTFNEIHEIGFEGVRIALEELFDETEHGCIIISTYETFRSYKSVLLTFEWSAVCLDEGQKIKNTNTEISQAVKMLQTPHRIILSGTPIQNTLQELWNLYDFTSPGLLGTLQAFELEFASPIRQGGYTNATRLQSEVAVRTASTLQKIIKPFLLRRKKDEVSESLKLPPKTEQVLFCLLSDSQRTIYKDIINSSEIQAVLDRKMPAFKAINTLRKLCNHPSLVFQNGNFIWSIEDDIADINESLNNNSSNSNSASSFPQDIEVSLVKQPLRDFSWDSSGKLIVLSKILPLWFAESNKVLIFSQTQSMLNLVEVMIKQLSYSYLRLDGSTTINKRQGIIESFNNDPSIFVLLLTTRTGGVGISLTAANRVVIVDPDWNPQTDIQARERSWRIGQKREVIIYRLITRGTIEEKIYHRQVYKELLSNRILENPNQKRIFSRSALNELFELVDHADCIDNIDLPTAGEVDLQGGKRKKTQNLNKRQIDGKRKRESQSISAISRSSKSSESSSIICTEKNGFKIESICEAESDQEIGDDNDDDNGEEEGKEESSRDRRLLKALFDGEAISSVYDHSFFEDDGKSDAEKKMIAEGAKKIVEDALRHLQESSTNRFNSNSASIETGKSNRFGSSSSSDSSSNQAYSSLTLLKNMKKSQTASSDFSASNETANNANILSRLKRLFEVPFANYTTHEILSKFNDLDDKFAIVFREMLRTVAKFQDNKWVRKN